MMVCRCAVTASQLTGAFTGHVVQRFLRLPSVGGFEYEGGPWRREGGGERFFLAGPGLGGPICSRHKTRPRARDGGSGHPAWRRCRAEPDRKR